MGLHRLDNAAWGFRSNCFVCEASNPAGLHLDFVYDDEAELVRAEFSLGREFSGAPSYVHGGIVLALMDEAMAWAAIAIAHRWALTRQSTATFLRPVLVNHPHCVVGRLDSEGPDGTLQMRGSVIRAGPAGSSGQTEQCAQAHATFVPLSAEAAGAAVGQAPGPSHRAYLRRQPG